MCNKTSATTAPSRMQTRSMFKNQTRASLKPARRTRTKIRKPKFLSLLKLEVSPEKTTQTQDTHRKKQLNLFPLHPENLVRERDAHAHEDDDVAFLLDSSDGSATLNGLLDNGGEGVDTPTTTATGVSSEDLTSSYAYRDQDCATTSLLRTAMKGKERDVETTEEKWVCYSEVTSCAADVGGETTTQRRLGLLSLKLDYEEIMNAWSDKGSLYLQGESSSQIVPDLHDELFPHENGNVRDSVFKLFKIRGKKDSVFTLFIKFLQSAFCPFLMFLDLILKIHFS